MKRKATAIGLIVLICLIGLIAINLTGFSLDFMAHLEGYNGCQSSIKLPYILVHILSEIGMVTLMISLYVYSLFFKLSKTAVNKAIIFNTINLAIMGYFIFSYPLLEKVSAADWGGNLTNSSVLVNPLLYISILSSLVLALLIRRHRAIQNNSRLNKRIYLLVIVLSALELIVVLATPIETCIV